MEKILGKIKNLCINKHVYITILIVIIGVGFFNKTQMSLLYSDLDLRDSNKIMHQIESMNIDAKVVNSGSTIYIPFEEIAQVKMRMAKLGLPKSHSIDYKIFDRTENTRIPDLIQDINHIRTLEKEISLSILTMSKIEHAKVHLVLPKRKIISRDKQKISASVTLSINKSRKLSVKEIRAIQYMTASTVPGLKPSKVFIVIDSNGNSLDRSNDSLKIHSKSLIKEIQINYENHLSEIIENLLEKYVGINKVRAEVSIGLNHNNITRTHIQKVDGIKKLSINVIVDGIYSKDKNGNTLYVSVYLSPSFIHFNNVRYFSL